VLVLVLVLVLVPVLALVLVVALVVVLVVVLMLVLLMVVVLVLVLVLMLVAAAAAVVRVVHRICVRPSDLHHGRRPGLIDCQIRSTPLGHRCMPPPCVRHPIQPPRQHCTPLPNGAHLRFR